MLSGLTANPEDIVFRISSSFGLADWGLPDSDAAARGPGQLGGFNLKSCRNTILPQAEA